MSNSAAPPPDAPPTAPLDALVHRAWALHQQGRLAEARALYLEVLAADAQNVNGLHLLGVMSLQTGRFDDAAGLIARTIAVHPGDVSIYVNRGLALLHLGRAGEAAASFGRAVALDAGHADAHYNRGGALQALGRGGEALASYGRALALDPAHAEALHNRGAARHALGRMDEALAGFERALAVRPHLAESHYCRGNALKDLRRGEDARASYDRAIALKPDYADAFGNRGTALKGLNRPAEALAGYGRALAVAPGSADAHYNRGLALQESRRGAEALAGYARALALKPDHADAWYNRGLLLHESRRLTEAVAGYDRAIAIRPDYAEARLNGAMALLLAGDFRRGWPLFEWRWMQEPLASVRRGFPQPLWLGTGSLEGRTILLHSEQGFGDTIQFCRYAALVAARGARVIMEVRRDLMAVLQGLEGVAELVVQGAALPPFDFHCPLLSLPLAFETGIGSIPGSRAYLRSDGARVAEWSKRLALRTKPRVGIAWSGSVVQRNNHNRRVGLAALLERMPAGCEVVSLQKEVESADRTILQAHPHVRRSGESLADFADTAALCELLDVIVTVDTSVAHLSAALGRPTWVLLSYEADWRWLLDRDDSPWYPGMRLYRQGADRDWTPVLDRVRADLARLAP